MKTITELKESLTEAKSRLLTLTDKSAIDLCNKRIKFITATLAKYNLGSVFFEGSNIIVENKVNDEYRITNKNNGDTWFSDEDGCGSIPERYMDTYIEAEFLRGIKVMMEAGRLDNVRNNQ